MERQKKFKKKLNVVASLKLIEAVKKRTLIWNKRSQHYKNMNRLHHAWSAIASETDMAVNDAKLLWKNLLAGFRVCKAKVRKSQRTGSDNDEVYKPNWFAYSAMLFLLEQTNVVSTSNAFHADAAVCRRTEKLMSKSRIPSPSALTEPELHANPEVCSSIEELTSKSPIPSLSALTEPEINETEVHKKTSKKLIVDASFKLIEAVKKRPLLWCSSHQHLKNKTAFHHEWAAVAAEVNLPVEEARIRWKNLLSCFRVYKSKVKKSQQSGAGNDQAYRPVWFAYRAMLFLGDHTNEFPQDDSLKEEATDSETVTLVNLPNNTLVCKSLDKLTAKPLETCPTTCPKPQTQVANALPIVPRFQPRTVRVVRTIPKQMEDPLLIKPKSQTQPMQVGPQTNTFPNRGSPGGCPSLLKSFVNLIEHELAELPKDYATMAQVDIYKIIGEYKLKDVERRSTQNSKSAAFKPMHTKVAQETITECSVPMSIKIEQSNSLENNDVDAS